MTVAARLDDRGRITVPASVREKLGFNRGDLLEIRVEDSKLILSPFKNEEGKKLEELIGDLKFDRSSRREAESWLGDQNI